MSELPRRASLQEKKTPEGRRRKEVLLRVETLHGRARECMCLSFSVERRKARRVSEEERKSENLPPLYAPPLGAAAHEEPRHPLLSEDPSTVQHVVLWRQSSEGRKKTSIDDRRKED